MPAKNLIPQELGLRHNHWEDSPGEGVGVLGDGKGRRKYWRPVGKVGLGYLLVLASSKVILVRGKTASCLKVILAAL